jgi:hypothetical protein
MGRPGFLIEKGVRQKFTFKVKHTSAKRPAETHQSAQNMDHKKQKGGA